VNDPKSVRATYKAMLALRRQEPALRMAGTTFLDMPEPILAFRRGDLLCAFNLSPQAAEADLPGEGEPRLAQDGQWTGSRLWLGPNGAIVARVR
jgi:alpha-glucosidase